MLVVVVVVAFVAPVHVCLRLLSPQAGPRASITSPPLQFSMELDKAEYQYGENITVSFELRNIGNQTITVGKPSLWPIHPSFGILTEAYGVSIPQGEHFLDGLFHFGLAITDSNGTEIVKARSGELQMTYDIALEPSGYIKQTTILFIPPLPKGTYQIRGIQYCGVSGLGLIALETPSITFVIRPTPLEFSVGLEKTEFQQGENVTIRLSLKKT